jgi:hypothetical protein
LTTFILIIFINTLKKQVMTIVLDFDGTCVANEYPRVGSEIGATKILKELVANGHQLVLFTMRSNKRTFLSNLLNWHSKEDDCLTEAVNWFSERKIPLYGIQKDPNQKTWVDLPKLKGELIIDDAALDCPLVYPLGKGKGCRPYVDWQKVRDNLVRLGVLPENEKSVC